MVAYRWVHHNPTYRQGTSVKKSVTGARAHRRRGHGVRGYWRRQPVSAECRGKADDPGGGEILDMAISLFQNVNALSDPLAWMELLGYLNPWLRKLLALLIFLFPSVLASVVTTFASDILPVTLTVGVGTITGPGLLAIAFWILHRQQASN